MLDVCKSMDGRRIVNELDMLLMSIFNQVRGETDVSVVRLGGGGGVDMAKAVKARETVRVQG